ncbi:hypothetical protein [Prevotella sp. oral taxon 306]|jgi:hypothetical protein|nr:hypothetical protein [Prevotella sp. oral taxon 306]
MEKADDEEHRRPLVFPRQQVRTTRENNFKIIDYQSKINSQLFVR